MDFKVTKAQRVNKFSGFLLYLQEWAENQLLSKHRICSVRRVHLLGTVSLKATSV